QLAGGAVKLNAARAHDVFEAKVARRMNLPLADAAYGAHVIAASNMMRAIRAVSSERGRDPREYALFAFGGNGPLFAAGMARQPASLGEVYGRMEAEARAQLAAEGFREDAIRIRRSADCRYEGQSFELTVPVSGGPFDAALLAGIEEAFGREHQRTYGHKAGDDEP